MEFEIVNAQETDIESHRRLFLSEAKFQFIYNKCHGAGWVDNTFLNLKNALLVMGQYGGRISVRIGILYVNSF